MGTQPDGAWCEQSKWSVVWTKWTKQYSRGKLLEPLTMRKLGPYIMGWGYSFHYEFLFLIMEKLKMFKC